MPPTAYADSVRSWSTRTATSGANVCFPPSPQPHFRINSADVCGLIVAPHRDLSLHQTSLPPVSPTTLVYFLESLYDEAVNCASAKVNICGVANTHREPELTAPSAKPFPWLYVDINVFRRRSATVACPPRSLPRISLHSSFGSGLLDTKISLCYGTHTLAFCDFLRASRFFFFYQENVVLLIWRYF